MVDSGSRKRALEILANPLSKESEWLGALAILDGKVPVDRSKSTRKYKRFLKRVAGLSVAYTALFSIYGMIFYGSGFYWTLIPAAILWAVLEASAGLFTALAVYVMLSNLGSILTLSPYYQTTWMVILINVFSYARFSWRPYVFVPIRRLIGGQQDRKLLN